MQVKREMQDRFKGFQELEEVERVKGKTTIFLQRNV
jgi:hypothetical protein